MKLGIISNFSDPLAISAAAAKGLSFVEYCVNVGTDVADFTAAIDRIKEETRCGVSVGSIGRWGSDKIAQDGSIIENELKASYQLIDACAELSCPVFNAGCNTIEGLSFYENCTAAIDFFGKLIEYAKGKNVKIATYNCRWNNFVHSDPAWKVILGQLPLLGIKFDPSHCIYDGGDYLSEMKKWGNRFYHIHLKGSVVIDGERFDDPPIGLDQTNWGVFMEMLYYHKYEGGLSIEPHSAHWKDELGEWGVDFSIKYIKPYIYSK